MKQSDYSGEDYIKHMVSRDTELVEQAKRIDDPLLRDVLYNMAQIVARFADDEDENILRAIDGLEDKITDIKELEARQ